MKTKVKGDRFSDRWACERQNEASAPVCHIGQKRVGPKLGARCNAFSHITVPIATLVRFGTGEAMTKMSGIPVAVRNQPGIVLRECEAWTVVDRNSRNARVFGARYWREG
jgi:hypothetical protein